MPLSKLGLSCRKDILREYLQHFKGKEFALFLLPMYEPHYKLPLGPISKLGEHKIIFFEVLLEGFNANKAKKFEKQSFFNMEK